jgi:Ricin-type beta-trefoil lectin domain
MRSLARRSTRRLYRVVTVVAMLAAGVVAIPGTAYAGPIYKVINYNSAKCLDIAGVSMSDGADAHQWTCHGNPNQRWEFTSDWWSDGYLLLVVQHSGKCLDVSGPSTADGAQVHQWTCHSGFNQQWSITGGPLGGTPVPGSGRYQLKNRYSGKCLEVAGGSGSQGATIRQWTCNGGLHQLWVVAT